MNSRKELKNLKKSLSKGFENCRADSLSLRFVYYLYRIKFIHENGCEALFKTASDDARCNLERLAVAEKRIEDDVSRAVEDVIHDWQKENIRIFKAVVGKHGCRAGWEIAKKFANFKNSDGSPMFEGMGCEQNPYFTYIQIYGFTSFMCHHCKLDTGYTALCENKDSYNPSQRPYPSQFPRGHRWNTAVLN